MHKSKFESLLKDTTTTGNEMPSAKGYDSFKDLLQFSEEHTEELLPY